MFSESKQRTGVGLVLTVEESGVTKPFLPPTVPTDDAAKFEGVRRACPINSHILGKPVTPGGRVLDHKYGILGGAVDATSDEIEENPYSLGQELAREVSEEFRHLMERTMVFLDATDVASLIVWIKQLISTIQNIQNSDFYSFTGIRVGQFLENKETGEHTLRGIFEVKAVQQNVPNDIAQILKKVGFSVPTDANQIRPYVREVLNQLGYGTK
jgi:hypothetical protein